MTAVLIDAHAAHVVALELVVDRCPSVRDARVLLSVDHPIWGRSRAPLLSTARGASRRDEVRSLVRRRCRRRERGPRRRSPRTDVSGPRLVLSTESELVAALPTADLAHQSNHRLGICSPTPSARTPRRSRPLSPTSRVDVDGWVLGGSTRTLEVRASRGPTCDGPGVSSRMEQPRLIATVACVQPTFVLVHGAFANSFSFAPLQAELALLGHRSLASTSRGTASTRRTRRHTSRRRISSGCPRSQDGSGGSPWTTTTSGR